ncbi:MAG TPA: hypothetical protein VHB47_18305 [Thermoanaerobaculia bacterium]|nr:hypothetical protein [Thermoanaerobaculia bacterium]
MPRRGADDKQLQEELERLYDLPPGAFTGARNELAARLRREGRRDAAAEVKTLPRPTASAWATSRLMRLEPARFRALLAAGGQARQAQRQALGRAAASNAAAAARLRDALRQARTLIEELRRRGLELLGASGSPVSSGTADRLGANLQALAYTAGAESAVARGWLDHDLEPPGFEVLAGLQAAAGGAGQRATSGEEPAGKGAARGPIRRPEPRPAAAEAESRRGGRAPRLLPEKEEPPARHPAARDAARARLQAARERQEQARRERDRAFLQQARERQRARLAEAETAVQRAAAESERLAAAAAAAERAAVAAESEAAEARQRAGEARREAERAHRGAERARQLLDGAGARLAAARASAAPGFKASAAGRRPGGGPR